MPQTHQSKLRAAVSSVTKLFKNKDVHRPPSSVRRSTEDRGTEDRGRSRPIRREPDIPFDRIEHAYTPKQTSLKSSFRASGADQQRDQEFASGVADDRWNDEDRFTNKSGDPRIGTHGRTYEPGE